MADTPVTPDDDGATHEYPADHPHTQPPDSRLQEDPELARRLGRRPLTVAVEPPKPEEASTSPGEVLPDGGGAAQGPTPEEAPPEHERKPRTPKGSTPRTNRRTRHRGGA